MPSVTNPYVFIPLGKPLNGGDSRAQGEDGDLITAVIHCTLTTKKKLIVPAVEQGDDEMLHFFQLPYSEGGHELPVIPGSSIRGVIRGVYEAMTHSCMRPNTAHDARLASVGGRKEPGLLYYDAEFGRYVLCEAVRYKIWDEDMLAKDRVTGDVVDFRWDWPRNRGGKGVDNSRVVTRISKVFPLGSTDYHPKDVAQGRSPHGTTRGVFLKVDKLNNSHPSVLVGTRVLDVHVDKAYVEALEDNAARYKENKQIAESANYLACLNKMKDGSCVLPVWYARQRIGGAWHYQFAHAQLSRVVYAKTVNKFYEEEKVSPCTSANELCPACSLFGFVSPLKGDESARASRVRFGDATLCSEDARAWQGFGLCLLPELMEPRVSSFEFYLRNTNTPHVFTPELPDTELAGRKFYWHHAGNEKTAQESTKTKDKGVVLNSKAEFVPANKHFQFDVYVDGVTKLQLNQLLFALSLGEYWDDTQGSHCHKMGRGKPYGYGSVSVEVADIHLRTISPDSYVVKRIDSDSDAIMSKGDVAKCLVNVTAIRNVTLLGAGGQRVDYPRWSKDRREAPTIFGWFFGNRQLFASTGGLVGYRSTLPSVPANKELSAREIEEKQMLEARPETDNNVFIAEAAKVTAGTSERLQQVAAAPRGSEGTIDSARFSSASGHWSGWIKRPGQSNIFFHTSGSPKLDPRSLDITSGMRVRFVVGKNKQKGKNCGKPMAYDIEFLF